MTPTDPTHDALLRAVLTEPTDDLPRLAMADWMEENAGEIACGQCNGRGLVIVRRINHQPYHTAPRYGDCPDCDGSGRVSDGRTELAEFIRIGCELAQLGQAGPFDRIEALRRRERDSWGGWPDRHDVRSYFHDSLPFVPGGWSVGTDSMQIFRDRPQAIVRRGFVSEIRITSAAFLGGMCGACNGQGCYVCVDHSGIRVVRGCAAALFAAQPIESVILTDREPLQLSGISFAWGITGSGIQTHQPGDVTDLAYACHDFNIHLDPGSHVTGQAAISALSDACVAFGRAAAKKLPDTRAASAR